LQQHNPAFLMCSMIAGWLCALWSFINAVVAAEPMQELQLTLWTVTWQQEATLAQENLSEL